MLLNPGGKVTYNGKDITGIPSHALVGLGIALCPEGRGVFARLNVHENLLMGAYARNDKAQILTEVDEIYTMIPRLKERTQQMAGTLSGGEQQMLAIGRAMLALEHANRGYVLESGEITLTGDAKTLLADPRVKAAYLGG